MYLRHDIKEVYSCDKCDLSFGHLNELKLHKHESHGETFHSRKEVGQQVEEIVEMIH